MVLYTARSDEDITVRATRLSDIELAEATYKADFELGKRYGDFVKEMVRFSLLGIAGYGFLIKVILTPVGLRDLSVATLILMASGIAFLGASAGLGLYSGELNKTCLRMQITILRLLQRQESKHWTDPDQSSMQQVEEWKQSNQRDLERIRGTQRVNLLRTRWAIRATVWTLFAGILLTAIAFVVCSIHVRGIEVKKDSQTAKATE